MIKRVILLFLIILFAVGCKTNFDDTAAPSHAPEIVPLDQELQDAQDKIHNTLDNPDATVEDLLEAWGIAQQLGVENDLGLAQQFGFDQTIEQIITQRIQKLLLQELANPMICKRRAVEILALAQQLGLPEVEKVAEVQAQIGADICGESSEGGLSIVEMSHSGAWDEGWDTPVVAEQTFSATFTGRLVEYALFDRRDEDSRTYQLKEGTMSWNFNEWVTMDCGVVTRAGSGTEQIGPQDGSVTIYDDGSYGGYFSKEVELQGGGCGDTDLKQTLEAYVGGTLTNYSPGLKKLELTGSTESSRPRDPENGIVYANAKTSWSLKLPD